MNPKISLVFCVLVSVATALYNAPGTRHGLRNGGWGGNTWPGSNIHPSLLKQDIFGNDGIQHYPGSNHFPNNLNSWGSRRNPWSGSSNSFYPRDTIRTHRLNGRRYKRSLYRSPYSNSGKQFGLNRDSHFNQQQLLNNQHLLDNQQIIGNRHILGNQQLLNNQHLLDNQQIIGNRHILGNQQWLNNQHLLDNQHLLGNQQPWDLQNNQQFFGNQQIGGGIRNTFPRRRY
ncbi:hypothetical protein LOTGIDRAFT_237020 [Lottia gigantea]|uniref:Uncharacterized protein n=1 Tax=Lottia gigantea TaxID=225164 RepID=V3ZED5_LOTGI|nr:hypothetical protein LOTGIDRAFT_237020 [Lottia gigantea]ESO82422.1 hypothetical protein LOTGIDRAFT_237020 [Lottia gigantea]